MVVVRRNAKDLVISGTQVMRGTMVLRQSIKSVNVK